MTTDDDLPLSPMEQDDALAAEYVLGVLALPERLAAEARIKNDSAFAARVVAWESRLAPMNDDFVDLPAPDLLPQIEARLFPQPAPAPRRSWRGWLAGALTAAAVVIATAVLLLPPVQGPVIATLGEADATLRFEARFDGSAITVIRVAGAAAPSGQVQELWIIAPEAAPVSLGLLAGDSLSTPYPDAPAGWTLAVSLEPEGGSPTGAPTGPVLAAGVISDI
jgi:anti-sigma-K factor RskA